jgi:hypothetical protein
MKVVQERLGHSSFAITADIYSHVAPDLQEQAAGLLGAALRSGVDPRLATKLASKGKGKGKGNTAPKRAKPGDAST